nr:malate dehydrogenase, cytoplasmic [Quercus suber]
MRCCVVDLIKSVDCCHFGALGASAGLLLLWTRRIVKKVDGAATESLNGIRMEMTDAAFPLLKGVVATTDVVEACKDVNIAVMLGGYPLKEITLRICCLQKNH